MTTLGATITQERLEDAEARLAEACREIIALQRALDHAAKQVADHGVQARFWKRACEQALDSWNRLEDEHAALLARTAGRQ